VLLAGDAAHIHFPAGGHGLNLGVQNALIPLTPDQPALRSLFRDLAALPEVQPHLSGLAVSYPSSEDPAAGTRLPRRRIRERLCSTVESTSTAVARPAAGTGPPGRLHRNHNRKTNDWLARNATTRGVQGGEAPPGGGPGVRPPGANAKEARPAISASTRLLPL
jgi:hypothetical protein